jgi:hypothetical protein
LTSCKVDLAKFAARIDACATLTANTFMFLGWASREVTPGILAMADEVDRHLCMMYVGPKRE